MSESGQEGVAPAFVTDVSVPSMLVTCSEMEAWDEIDRAKKAPTKDKPTLVPLVRVINGICQNVIMKIIGLNPVYALMVLLVTLIYIIFSR